MTQPTAPVNSIPVDVQSHPPLQIQGTAPDGSVQSVQLTLDGLTRVSAPELLARLMETMAALEIELRALRKTVCLACGVVPFVPAKDFLDDTLKG